MGALLGAYPIAVTKRKHVQGHYYEAAASDIDPERQLVTCEYQQPNCSEEARRFTIPYDVLVVAVSFQFAG